MLPYAPGFTVLNSVLGFAITLGHLVYGEVRQCLRYSQIRKPPSRLTPFSWHPAAPKVNARSLAIPGVFKTGTDGRLLYGVAEQARHCSQNSPDFLKIDDSIRFHSVSTGVEGYSSNDGDRHRVPK